MAKRSASLPGLTGDETIWGFGFWAIQLLLMPSILNLVNDLLPQKLSQTELNFTFFLINFLAVIIIFHRYLSANGKLLTQHPVVCAEGVILGFVGYSLLSMAVNWGVHKLDPGFVNANNANIAALSRGSLFLMAVGTVILVPPVEECLYRGLIFRSLYSKNHTAAYLVSIAVFALVHMLGFLGNYSPLQLLLCFLQYVPGGLCLAWSYVRGGTLFTPILIHALINAQAIQSVR